MMPNVAAPEGGHFFAFGRQVLVLDSITQAIGLAPGSVVVSGSHGGLSAGRFAIEAQTFLAVFNDAGVGKDGAGIAALALMAQAGMAACAVAHSSARIGEAASTLEDGILSHVNPQAAWLGLRPGAALKAVLISSSVSESSPAHR
jgi:hypothetical protein